MYENMELTTEVYFEEMRKLDKEQRSADNYYKRYVQEFDIWFNSLDYDQQVKIIWQNIKCIEVDFETKELRFNSYSKITLSIKLHKNGGSKGVQKSCF